MLIRTEIPVDAMKIDQLLRKAFNGSAEANLVQQLREDGLLTLGVVATDDDTGKVIGYAAFSPVSIMGQERQWVGLAPLAVAEPFRHQGIGQQLIYDGMDMLNEFGYAAIVTLGDPDYYAKLGFEPAARYGLHCRWPETEAAFQIYALDHATIPGASGLVSYSAPFDRL